MSKVKENVVDQRKVDQLYADIEHWHVNTGGTRIHAKQVSGRYRNFKYFVWFLWFGYFVGPYLRWNGGQAVLFDIPNRQFHLFGATVYPQDIWMLSLALIVLAMTLFGVTAVAGRVFCGYFCFQTVWTDWFTWIEAKIEGNPIQRRKLDAAPWNGEKIRRRLTKWSLWAAISLLTGISFAAYFTDAFGLWHDLLTFQAAPAAWMVLLLFFLGTFILAGFMREQVCFWLCPYARIQGVMMDKDTIVPTYDLRRGEPRGKLRAKGGAEQGDCIDCKLCVAVCPTGVDIREGQQEGCITCGLCIDACDHVMDQVGRPQGLIRYASHKEMQGVAEPPLYKRPRVIIYSSIFTVALSAIIYGLATIPPLEWLVAHERQPLYTQMSDGSVQNSYTFKILNKTPGDLRVHITAGGIEGLELREMQEVVVLKSNKMVPFTVRLRAQPDKVAEENAPIVFKLQSVDDPALVQEYESFFVRPPL